MVAESAVEDTRARILQVARALIAEEGFPATSTRELSDRLGFTKAALYYHFRTKEDLLAALIEPAVDELERLVSAAEPRGAAGARRAALSAYVDYVTRHRDLIRVITEDPAVARGQTSTRHEGLYWQLAA